MSCLRATDRAITERVKIFHSIILFLAVCVAGDAAARTFTSTDGREIEAEVVNYNPADGKVVIRLVDNRKFTVPFDRFSEADQEYLTTWRDEYDRSFVSLEFMTLRVRSSRVAFVIDKSGSMTGARWDKVVRNLEAVIGDLETPSDFNIITFGSSVSSFRDDLAPVNEANKIAAINWVQSQYPAGGTATGSALRRAFESDEVETVILLSDGYPSGSGAGIIADVKQWQARRENPVTIHTISYQAGDRGSEFMRDLAEANEGKFIRR